MFSASTPSTISPAARGKIQIDLNKANLQVRQLSDTIRDLETTNESLQNQIEELKQTQDKKNTEVTIQKCCRQVFPPFQNKSDFIVR